LSSSQKQRIVVSIFGLQYPIIGDESPAHIRAVANIVDEKMNEIYKKNPLLDTNKLAVMTAINLVSDYVKMKEKLELLEQKIETTNKGETEQHD
jgi:cell division protein ZapA